MAAQASVENELNRMIQSAKDGNFKKVFEILDRSPSFANMRPETRKWAAIHQACYWGDLDNLRKLVEQYNADVFLKTKEGQSAIEVAQECGRSDVVKYLEAQVNKARLPSVEADVLGIHIVIYDNVPVNELQSRSSTVVTRVQKDARVEVLEFAGEPIDGRVRARIASPAGWISTRMADGTAKYVVKAEETVTTCVEEADALEKGEFEPGSTCTVCHAALPVTVSEHRGSTELAKLSMGAMVEVLANAQVHEGRERAKIAGLKGWITTEVQNNETDKSTLKFVKAEAGNSCIVERDFLPVTASGCRGSTQLAELRQGTRIEMLGTPVQLDEGRVRANIACPSGWISTRKIDGTAKYVKASSAADDVNEAIEETATADDLQDRLEKLRSLHPEFDFATAEQVLQNRRDEEMPVRLFHGTSRGAAEAIQKSTFKPSPSDGNNPEELGKGVYVVDKTNVPKALRFAHDCFMRSHGASSNEPVLIECDVFVRKGHYKRITGSDPEVQWHAEGYDAVFAEKTSKSNSSEVCVYDPRRIKVVAVHDLRGTACPWDKWCPYQCVNMKVEQPTPWNGSCPCTSDDRIAFKCGRPGCTQRARNGSAGELCEVCYQGTHKLPSGGKSMRKSIFMQGIFARCCMCITDLEDAQMKDNHQEQKDSAKMRAAVPQ